MNVSIRRLLVLCFVLAASACVASAQFNGDGWNNGLTSNYGVLYCYGPGANCLEVFCSADGGEITMTNEDWSSGQTEFEVTVPYYITPGQYNVSCNGGGAGAGAQGTITVLETWPIINAGGVVNDTYGGNSVTVGTSGYLSVYGIGLTAGGKTPSPTISVDDPTHIVLTLSYASDLQVNLHFNKLSGASSGTHSLYITTEVRESNAGTFTVVQ